MELKEKINQFEKTPIKIIRHNREVVQKMCDPVRIGKIWLKLMKEKGGSDKVSGNVHEKLTKAFNSGLTD
jgi:hypothetical protein